ncbi:uncharacterized protein MELLADRAFT_41988 [Melampsora larici-populina 98AG31]|uniref:Amino acid transporter transmembrane domain-containing protein n=1 Tax=Melampsora larici-populina (strain 98AG31 / pathotype 3-4-7) TaxID=747676 RepID=F4R8S2_MELLP|nr:uncharacterized protein MELLADRAFT_41988 [Melampsora larici-populina 98AG31]EGG10856.1 hypothetical protein MELLADRAFT_41988 [Melampsora larici-populina 98AG31]
MSHSSDQASDSNQNQNQINTNASNLSNQLSDLRQAYQRTGSNPPLPNIPLPSSSYSNYNPELNNSYKTTYQPDKNSHENSDKTNGSPSTQRIPILKHASSVSSRNQMHGLSFQSLSSRLHPPGTSGVSPSQLNVEDLTDEQKARIVKRHLMNKDEQEAARRITSSSKLNDDLIDPFDPNSMDSDEPNSNRDSDVEPSGSQEPILYPTPYHLQGGDIHHDLYKWANNLRISEQGTATAINDTPSDSPPAMAYKDIMQPGGFRRAFLYQKRQMIGEPYNGQDSRKFTKSFVDFLSLYGHFGGEDLEEIDEEDEAAYHALQGLHDLEDGDFDDEHIEEGQVGERSALLGKSNRKVSDQRSRPINSRRSSGDATVTQAVLMLLKSLVGTGVLFLAKAFSNGGMLFSVLTLVFISMISTYSFVLLVRTRLQIPGGFGEIGGILYGPWCRWAILSSLVISQLGFVAAYTIFIAQNLQAFVLAITNCKLLIPIYVLIFGQLIAYLPLSMIRNIQKLSGTALIADVFILIGLVYVFGYEINLMATVGVAPIQAFNPDSFPLLIGTAVFAFEGIGLVIPITESMKQPEKFPKVLTGVMVGLTFLFAGAGALGYAAFGSDVQTVVIVNLPQEDKMVNAVQFLYSMAIMLSTPLQLFPAVRIMENGLFSTSGKYSNKVKWEKNLFRTLTVIFCSFIAWAGASDLDKFVSLIGSVACVPLCFCYPAMLHYRARAKTVKQKIADIALFIFGVLAAIYTTAQTLSIIFGDIENGKDDGPKYGNCDVVP